MEDSPELVVLAELVALNRLDEKAYKKAIQKEKNYSFVIAGWNIAVNNFGPGFLFDRQLTTNFKAKESFSNPDCYLSFFQTSKSLPNFVCSPMAFEKKTQLMKSAVVDSFDVSNELDNDCFISYSLSAHAFSAKNSELRVFSYKTGNPYLKLSVPFMALLANYSALNDGLLLHGAGGEFNGKAFAILGVPDAGKSTAIQLIEPQKLFSDDVLIMRVQEGKAILHSTPLGTFSDGAGSAPLKAVFYPVKSDHFELKELSKFEAIQRFYPAQSGYWDKVFKPIRNAQFEKVSRLFSSVRAFKLHFQKDRIDAEQIKACLD